MFKAKNVCAGLLVLLAALVFLVQPASAKYRWKMATSWPTGIPLFTDMAQVFADKVESLSGGEMQIRVLPGGTVCPALEITDNVRKGVVELGHTWPGYDIGRGPATALLGGYAGGMESVPMMHWLYVGGGKELWREYRQDKFDVISMPMGIRPPEAFAHSHKPIRTLDDFNGLKMRTVGAWSQILPKLGASVVSLPGGEVYQALERKVIDATEWATPGENVISGFQDIAKYVIVPGVHQPSAPFELSVNMDKWNELTPTLQAIIETAAEYTTYWSWLKIGKLDMGALAEFKKIGNEIIYLNPETQARAKELGKEWAAEKAEGNPWFKKIMDSQNEFDKEWSAVGSIRYFDYSE